MLKDKRTIFFLILPLLLSFFICTNIVLAQTQQKDPNYGLTETVDNISQGSALTGNSDIPTLIGKAIGAGLAFIGVAFFGLMIYGGFLWMFARGNQSDVDKAKDLIYAAVIGLVIVLSAYAITSYISGILIK